MPGEIALSEPVRKALEGLAEIDTVMKSGVETLGERLYVSLLNQKEGLIDYLRQNCPGMIPYWTLDGYQMRDSRKYVLAYELLIMQGRKPLIEISDLEILVYRSDHQEITGFLPDGRKVVLRHGDPISGEENIWDCWVYESGNIMADYHWSKETISEMVDAGKIICEAVIYQLKLSI